jgi:hypothetical protein
MNTANKRMVLRIFLLIFRVPLVSLSGGQAS